MSCLCSFPQGADNVIARKMEKEADELKKTLEAVTRYAEDGLRVLMIGYREISEEDYECWKEQYSKAETTLENREELLSKCVAEVETGLTLLGVTAVEDRLQVGGMLVSSCCTCSLSGECSGDHRQAQRCWNSDLDADRGQEGNCHKHCKEQPVKLGKIEVIF